MILSGINTITTDPDDQCHHCANLLQCPLVVALCEQAVVMTAESLGVKNCRMFCDLRPPLTVIPGGS